MKRILAFITFSALLYSCISDGPNTTGADFLQEKGALSGHKLEEITLERFKVDSFRVETRDTSFLGNSNWLVGNCGNFSMKGRLGFLVGRGEEYKSDDLPGVDSLQLLLPIIRLEQDYILPEVNEALSKIDRVKLLVRTYLFRQDKNNLKETANDFFVRFHDIGTFEKIWPNSVTRRSLDTISLRIVPDTLQHPTNSIEVIDTLKTDSTDFYDTTWVMEIDSIIGASVIDSIGTVTSRTVNLPGAFKELQELRKTAHPRGKQYLFMELSLLDSTAANIMLNISNEDSLFHGPEQHTVPLDIMLYSAGLTTVIANNYTISHPLSQGQHLPLMLTGKTQGIHFYINREKLISAVRKESGGIIDITDKDADYNHQYFVPHSEITVKLNSRTFDRWNTGLNTSWKNRQSALDMMIQYEIDSTETGKENSSSSFQTSIPLEGDTIKSEILVYKENLDVVVDTLCFAFTNYKEYPENEEFKEAFPDPDAPTITRTIDDTEEDYFRPDIGLYKFSIIYSNHGSLNQETDIYLNETKEIKHKTRSSDFGTFYINLIVTADSNRARVSYNFNSVLNLLDHRNIIIDTDRARLHKDSSAIRFTSTYSIQTLLNRTNRNNNLHHDFFVMPRHLTAETAFYELPVRTHPDSSLLIDIKINFYKL